MAIVIRLLKKNETELANDFFNAVYKINRPIKNFNWEFVECPWGSAVYVIAVDESITAYTKVVGIQCGIPIELISAKGDILLTAKSEDTLVDPAYRGQKIFERMYDLLFEECKRAGIKFIWGFTPAKKAFERIGFQVPFMAHQALMVFNPVASYNYLSRLNPQNRTIDKVKIAGLTFLSLLTSFKALVTPSSKALSAKQLNISSKKEIIQKLTPGSPLYFLNMDEKYLEWRIGRNPFHNDYENHQFFHGDTLIADVIVNFRKAGIGYLEQIIFSDEASWDLKKGVIVHIVQRMKKKVNIIRVLCFDINETLGSQEALLKQCGFLILNRGAHFVWKSLGSDDIKPDGLFLSRLFTQGNQ